MLRKGKVDICSVSIPQLNRASSEDLFEGAARITSRDTGSQLVKRIMENLGAIKVSRRAHTGTMRHDSTRSYGITVNRLVKNLRFLKAKSCSR